MTRSLVLGLLEQIAGTEARSAHLDRELAAIRAGHLLDLPRSDAPDGEDTTADVPPAHRGAVRPLRQSGRPAKKQGHRRH